MNTTFCHCESQLNVDLTSTQLNVATSTKQSPCSDFEIKRVFNDYKNSFQLLREGRLLRRSFILNAVITWLASHLFQDAPRNDEGNDRKVFGGIKGKLLEGYLL